MGGFGGLTAGAGNWGLTAEVGARGANRQGGGLTAEATKAWWVCAIQGAISIETLECTGLVRTCGNPGKVPKGSQGPTKATPKPQTFSKNLP